MSTLRLRGLHRTLALVSLPAALALSLACGADAAVPPATPAAAQSVPSDAVLRNFEISGDFILLIDGKEAGSVDTPLGFVTLISWSGLDIGFDRSSPVGDYAAPFKFTGELRKVTVTMDDDQKLDGDAVGNTEMARQ